VTEIDIPLAAGTTPAQVKESIQGACRALGLTITREGSLAGYPGSIHWHIKFGREKGTLELTTWLPKPPLWAKIQAGRRADWIDRLLPQLTHQIQSLLGPKSPSS
jgi:hypothetical protein